MRAIKVSTGDRFGRLCIVAEVEKAGTHRRFKCTCDCGKTITAHLSALRVKLTTSCGCWRKERATIHGLQNTAEYRSWKHMIARCTDPKGKSWKNYGGRGITVCERWRKSFKAFLAHVGKRPTPQHSIDRYPNNDGNYEPGNVRWATMSEQHLNSRRARTKRGLPPVPARPRKQLARHIAKVFKPC